MTTRLDRDTPPDKHIVAAFERGRERGRFRTRYGRTQCPYGPTRSAYLRDAWLAGYDFGVGEGPELEESTR